GPDIPHTRFGILRKHQRQGNEAAAVVGPAGQNRKSVQAAVLPNDFLTPRARHIRSSEPNTFDATGISKPVGFSNRSAGPPPGALQARSVTAAISRSGLTASDRRASSLRLSRSARKS